MMLKEELTENKNKNKRKKATGLVFFSCLSLCLCLNFFYGHRYITCGVHVKAMMHDGSLDLGEQLYVKLSMSAT